MVLYKKIGKYITSQTGKNYKVMKLTGTTGQGEWYEVDCDGEKYSLKWFFEDIGKNRRLINDINELIQFGIPGVDFQWPIDVVCGHDSFGCICRKIPTGYYTFVDLMKNRVNPSFDVLCTICGKLASNMKRLHEQKFVLVEQFDFVFNPINGDVIITSWERIKKQNGTHIYYYGSPGLSSPEVVMGDTRSTVENDLFVLAIYLFYLLCVSHPFDGKKESSAKCLDYETTKQLYGSNPVFIFDPKDDSNRPVKGHHDNANVFWPIYPKIIQSLFIRCFTEGINNTKARPSEDEWCDVFNEMKKMITKCPNCGAEVFVEPLNKRMCWNCSYQVQSSDKNCNSNRLKALVGDNEYIWREPKRFKAFLMDYYPDNKLLRNLILACATEGIIDNLLITKIFNAKEKYRLSKVLMDSYGCSYSKAEEVISLWIDAFGIQMDKDSEISERDVVTEKPASTVVFNGKPEYSWDDISNLLIEDIYLPSETVDNLRSLGATSVGDIIRIKGPQYLIELLETRYHPEDRAELIRAIYETWNIHSVLGDDILDMHISELELGIRAYNCSRRAGIKFVSDYFKITKDEIFQIRNLGRKSYEQIEWHINDLGLHLIEDKKNTFKYVDVVVDGKIIKSISGDTSIGILVLTEHTYSKLMNQGIKSLFDMASMKPDSYFECFDNDRQARKNLEKLVNFGIEDSLLQDLNNYR